MEISIHNNEAAAAVAAARLIAEALRKNPGAVLGLATGKTMEMVYQELVRLHNQEGLDFSRCRTFNLDEYIGLAPEHPGSYHHYMRHCLFRHVNMDARNTHLPDGVTPDLVAECHRYEKLIREAGGIDLLLLGIGRNGHIGFNEPPADFNSRTHAAQLAAETIEQNGPFFGGSENMPRRAITMGVGTILDARHCILLAAGQRKAEVVAQALDGPVTPAMPATALRSHPECTVILDQAAATHLRRSRARDSTSPERGCVEDQPRRPAGD